MANEEHLAILKQGVAVWNRWRQEHRRIPPVLQAADLHSARLYGADLHEASLYGADLREADLRSTDLSQADLREADLRGAYLTGANLTGADLTGADLSWALLRDALLHRVLLHGATLRGALLPGADLSYAHMRETILDDLDVCQIKGLDTVVHNGPSDLGMGTISQSQGQISEVFLRGVGVPEHFIAYLRSLTGQACASPACFISHASQDTDFCQRLYHDLQGAGVRCWLDAKDSKGGSHAWQRPGKLPRPPKQLLLVLSGSSIGSTWVRQEVLVAWEQEKLARGQLLLFPIRLDRSAIASRQRWAITLRHQRNIGDFSYWKDHDAYQQALTRLLRDLKAETK